MKKRLWLGGAFVTVLAVTGFMVARYVLVTGRDPRVMTHADKLSYVMGLQYGKAMKAEGVDVAIREDLFMRAVNDARAGRAPLMSDAEVRQVLEAAQKDLMAKRAESNRSLAERNRMEGDAFLARNKQQAGVVTLPSGLQYKVLKAGSGARPKEGDTVAARYRGMLTDGTVFADTYNRQTPASFDLGKAIQGYREAVMLMPEGSEWQVVVPPVLGYGEQGGPRGSRIGPNQTLIFQTELVSVKQGTGPAKVGATASPAHTTSAAGAAGNKIELARK